MPLRHTPQTRSLAWLLAKPIAHRGLHNINAGVVENTASAFAAAIAKGYAIECDVQLSKDGEAVVFHDDTLDRVTKATGAVVDRSVADLQALPYVAGGDRMQTLSELLAQVAGKTPLVVEVKSHWNGDMRLTERVLQCTAEYEGPLAIMSFDPDVVEHCARVAPQQIRGIVADRVFDPYYNALSISRRVTLRSFAHLERTKPHFVSFDHAALPFAPVQQIRGQGFPVITWTITSPEAASRALRYSDQITFEGFQP